MRFFSWLVLIVALLSTAGGILGEAEYEGGCVVSLLLIAMIIGGIASLFLMFYLTSDQEWNSPGSALLSHGGFLLFSALSAVVVVVAVIAGGIWLTNQGAEKPVNYKKVGEVYKRED